MQKKNSYTYPKNQISKNFFIPKNNYFFKRKNFSHPFERIST